MMSATLLLLLRMLLLLVTICLLVLATVSLECLEKIILSASVAGNLILLLMISLWICCSSYALEPGVAEYEKRDNLTGTYSYVDSDDGQFIFPDHSITHRLRIQQT